MDQFDIFVSYSSKDKSVTDRLVAHIEKAGYTCWIAPRNIVGGVEYSEVIEKAILQCKIFVVVFSVNSEKSPWVKSELNIAFSENKCLIPYKIDETPLKGTMRLLLNDKHWIEKVENENKQMNLLLSAIQNYFFIQEKGEQEEPLNNPHFTPVVKKTKHTKWVVIFSLVGLLLVAGIVAFVTYFPQIQQIKNYNEFVDQAIALSDTSLIDLVNKRNFLEQARTLEKDIPASRQRDLTRILSEIKHKLDSIHYVSLDAAREFAIIETKVNDNQAIYFYKIALEAKENTAVRNEYNRILSRQGNYE